LPLVNERVSKSGTMVSGLGYEAESPRLTGTRCARVHGFSLHANTHLPAHRREQLERLSRDTGGFGSGNIQGKVRSPDLD
jgi:hypothetical protein